MRWIHEHGGPSPAYQSEVENGKRTSVQADLLNTWIGLLHVTEPFAQGLVPRLAESPEKCRGLAREVGLRVRFEAERPAEWSALPATERARLLFQLVARESGRLPRVVLAHVLGISVRALDAILVGDHPVMRGYMKAIAILADLPEQAFTNAMVEVRTTRTSNNSPNDTLNQEWAALVEYLPAARLAKKLGLSGNQVMCLIREAVT